MENASKALIIAGAILLAILLIGLGVFVYNQASHTVNDTNLDQLEVSKFNQQFEPYLNKEISGTTAKSLIQTIESSNFVSEPQVYCAGATQNDVKRAHTYETIVEYDNGVITKILLRDLDDNVIIGSEAENGGENGHQIDGTPESINSLFEGVLVNNLKFGGVNYIIRTISEHNERVKNNGYDQNVPTILYDGPGSESEPLVGEAKTYTAVADYDRNGYIITIHVTENSSNDGGDAVKR